MLEIFVDRVGREAREVSDTAAVVFLPQGGAFLYMFVLDKYWTARFRFIFTEKRSRT